MVSKPSGWPRVRVPPSSREAFTDAEWKQIKRAEHQVRKASASPICDLCGDGHDTRLCPSGRTPAEHWGTRKWRQLHLAAIAGGIPDAEWLSHWLSSIPNCGQCRDEARAWIAAHPPDLASPVGYFAWTVAMHNDVNAKLNKPTMSVADALAHWRAIAAQEAAASAGASG